MTKSYAPTFEARVSWFLRLIPVALGFAWLSYRQFSNSNRADPWFWPAEFPAMILLPLIPAYTYLRILSIRVRIEVSKLVYRVMFWSKSLSLYHYEGPLLQRRRGRYIPNQSAFLFWNDKGRLVSVQAEHFAADSIQELRALFENSGRMYKEKTYFAHSACNRALSWGALGILLTAVWLVYFLEVLRWPSIAKELGVLSLVVVVVSAFLVDAFALSVRVKVYSGKVFYHSLFRSRALPTESYERSTSTALLFRDGCGRRVLLPIFMLSRKDRDEIVCKIKEGTLAEQVGEVVEQRGSEGHQKD